MADKIKGITLEIGADAAGVKKALKDVDKEIKGTSSELKQVNRLLKLDPKNTELLAQKQELLAKEISSTSDKLEAMKKAKADLDEKSKNGTEVNREQYRYLQREIAYTEQKLGTLEKQAKETSEAMSMKYSTAEIKEAKENLEEYGEQLKGVGEKAKGAFAAVGVTGAAISSGGAYAVKFSSDYTKALNGFIAKSGIAESKANDFDKVMANIYKNNYGEDLNDIAEAMGTVAQNAADISPSNIEELTTNALILRDTFGYDISETMRAVNMLMDQFGLSGKEAFNLVAQGAQYGLDKNGDLLDSINEYSVHFKQLGFDADEMFNSLVNGAYSGTFSVDKLGDAVKEFGIRVKDNSDGTKGAFKTLGLNATDLTKKFNEGGEEGKKAFQQVTTALFEMKDKVKQNEVGVQLFGTMWEDLGAEGVAALTDLTGEITRTQNALDGINNVKYNDIESAVGGIKRSLEIDVIKPVGESLIPLVEEIIKTIKTKAPEIKKAIQDIAKKFLEFGNWILNKGETTAKIIASIAAAFVAVKTINAITETIKAFKALNVMLSAAKAKVVALNVAQKAQAAVTKIVTAAQWLWNAAASANPIGIIIAIITAAIATVVLLYNKCETFRNAVNNMLEGIQKGFSAAWEGIKLVWSAAKDFFKSVWEAIKGIFSFEKDVLVAYFRDAWEGIKLVWSVAKDFFKLIWENIKTVFSVVKSVLTGDFKGAWEGIKQIWNNTKEFFAGVWKKIKSAFKASEMKDIGVKLLKGLWNGINDTVDWLKKKVKGVVDKIKSWFTGKEGFDEHSPSKWAEKVGKFVMEGLANGVTKDMSAEEAFEKKIANLKNFISENLTEIQNDIANKQNSFSSNLKNKASLYDEYKITIADETHEGIKLKDWTKDLEKLTSYSSKLSGIEQRLRSLGGDAELDNTFLQLIRDMGMDGEKYIDVLINADDSQFAEYIDGFRMYQQEAEAVAEKTYATESAQLKKGFLDEVGGSIDSIVAAFGDGGADSAKAFGANFLSQIQSVLQEAANSIQSFATVVDVSGNLTAQSGTSISNTNNNKNISINIKNTGNTSTAYQQRLETEKMLDKLALQGVL